MRLILTALYICLFAGSVLGGPIEWPVSEGGNGHYYETFFASDFAGMSLRQVEVYAESLQVNGKSGHLATITTSAEHNFVMSNSENRSMGMFLYAWYFGAWNKQVWDPTHEADFGLRWVTGETFDGSAIGLNESITTAGALSLSAGYYLYQLEYNWRTISPDAPIDGDSWIVIEYDDLPVIEPFPDNPVAIEESTWGTLKSLYR